MLATEGMMTATAEWMQREHRAILDAIVRLDKWWRSLYDKGYPTARDKSYMDDAEQWIGERRRMLRNVTEGQLLTSEEVRTIRGEHRKPRTEEHTDNTLPLGTVPKRGGR